MHKTIKCVVLALFVAHVTTAPAPAPVDTRKPLPWSSIADDKSLERFRGTLLNRTMLGFLNSCNELDCCKGTDQLLCPLYYDTVRQLNETHPEADISPANLEAIINNKTSDEKICGGKLVSLKSKYYSYDFNISAQLTGARCDIQCFQIDAQSDQLIQKPICSVLSALVSLLSKTSVASRLKVDSSASAVVPAVHAPAEPAPPVPVVGVPTPQTGTNIKTDEVVTKAVKKPEPVAPVVNKNPEAVKPVAETPIKKSTQAPPAPALPETQQQPQSKPETVKTPDSVPSAVEKPKPIENKESPVENAPPNPDTGFLSETKTEEKEPDLDVPPLGNDESPDVDHDRSDGDEGYPNELEEQNVGKDKDTTVDTMKKGAEEAANHRQRLDYRLPVDDGYQDSSFFSYFLFGMVVCIIFYVVYHNKSKILGLMLEGRRGKGRGTGRRKHTAAYRKLDSNLEEAMTSSASNRSSQIIY